MIDPTGLLLQSPENSGTTGARDVAVEEASVPATTEPGALASILTVAVLVVLALGALACIRRWRLLAMPREPGGRIPVDPFFGGIAFLLAYAAGMLAASVPAGLLRPDDAWSRLAIGATANAVQWAAAVALLASRAFRDGPSPISSTRRAVEAGAIGLLLALPIVFATGTLLGVILPLIGFPKTPEVSHETLRLVLEKREWLFTAVTFAHVVVLVPIAEEALFRGLLQPSLRASQSGVAAAIAITSVVFTAIHWPSLPPDGRVSGLAMLLVLSVALGVLRERTGGFLAPAVAHAIFNALNVALALAP